jgi:AraC-like DNA-binding protein
MENLAITKSKHLLPFAAILSARGIRVHRLLKAAQLPLNCLDDPETLIPAVCVGRFRKLAAQKTGCPDLSLQTTRHFQFENMGDLGRKLLLEPTLLGSMEKFRKLVGTETSNVIIDLCPQANGDLWFGHQLLSQKELDAWHSNLYVIGWMLKIVRLADPAWSPAEISMRSKATQEHREVIEMTGSTARLEQTCTGFMVPAPMLALPVAKKTAQGEKKDVNPAPTPIPDSYAESLKQIIRAYANDGWLSVDEAGEATGQSVRTLQRRLATEQDNYSNLVQQCRLEMAGDLLENGSESIADIAHHLGYRNQGNFTRAFYRWAKVSPSEFRKHRSLKN